MAIPANTVDISLSPLFWLSVLFVLATLLILNWGIKFRLPVLVAPGTAAHVRPFRVCRPVVRNSDLIRVTLSAIAKPPEGIPNPIVVCGGWPGPGPGVTAANCGIGGLSTGQPKTADPWHQRCSEVPPANCGIGGLSTGQPKTADPWHQRPGEVPPADCGIGGLSTGQPKTADPWHQRCSEVPPVTSSWPVLGLTALRTGLSSPARLRRSIRTPRPGGGPGLPGTRVDRRSVAAPTLARRAAWPRTKASLLAMRPARA